MADNRFEKQVVMITGAAIGFGAETAERFADQGAKLVVSDVNKAGLTALADKLRNRGVSVFAQVMDVSVEAQFKRHVEEALAEHGQLNIAVNNAGIGHTEQPITNITVADFDKLMAVNVRGVFLGMKHQLPAMISRRSGVVLNVASAAGLVGASQMAAYAASKHAVIGLTRSAADEVARFNIRVNAICPSFADTPLFRQLADDVGDKHGLGRDQANALITGRIPMRRIARSSEVVQAILWACDPENTFMTGQALPIDGGLTAV